MKPPKFLLNPVRALNFFGGGRSWSGRGDEGGGGGGGGWGGGLSVFLLLFLFCLFV